jgi:hypothetical protein
MKRTEMPQFSGNPIAVVTMHADYLGGEFGKAVDAEVQRKYGKHQIINQIKFGVTYTASGQGPKNNEVNSTNPFYVVAVNMIIRNEGLRTARPSDMEIIFKNMGDKLTPWYYMDAALLLKDNGDPNSYLAQNLINQINKANIKKRGKRGTKGLGNILPLMIPLSELNLLEDSNSPHGLSFQFKKEAIVYHASLFNKIYDARFSPGDIDDVSGLPMKFDKDGTRSLKVTEAKGLKRLCYTDFPRVSSSLYGNLEFGVEYPLSKVIVIDDRDFQSPEKIRTNPANMTHQLILS